MLDHIYTIEMLEREALQIDVFLEEDITDDPEACIARGNILVTYLARTGKMLADAKYHKDAALKSSIMKELRDNGSCAPSIMKQLVDAACQENNYMVNWLERLNRTCVHQIDWLRTVVSMAKEERRVSTGVSGQHSSGPGAADKDYSPF